MTNSQLYGISLNAFYCIDSMEAESNKNSQDDLYSKLVTTSSGLLSEK